MLLVNGLPVCAKIEPSATSTVLVVCNGRFLDDAAGWGTQVENKSKRRIGEGWVREGAGATAVDSLDRG